MDTHSNQEEWIKFQIGSVFPSDSVLARWVSGLTLIANDLTQVNKHYLEESAKVEEKDTPESVFMFFLTCSLYREAAKFLRAGQNDPTIQDFIAKLSSETQDRWRSIQSSFTPWASSFVEGQVKPVRDALFHYPSPDSQEWSEALHALASRESGIRFGGAKMAEIRSVFADELRYTMLMSHFGSTEPELGKSISQMSLYVVQLLQFAHESIAEYLKMVPEDKLVFEP